MTRSDAIDLLSNYGITVALGFALGAILTFLLMYKRDKYFLTALLFIECMMFIAAATWGKGFVFEGYLSVTQRTSPSLEGVATASFGGVSTDDFLFGLLGVSITGLLGCLMMLFRYGLDKAGIVSAS